MLHTIAGEDFHPSVIHADRDAHDERPLGQLQPLPKVGIQMHGFGGLIELRDGEPEGVGVEFLHGPHQDRVEEVSEVIDMTGHWMTNTSAK
jgi:hypothetical protein